MSKGKILAVDDERKIVSTIRSYLEREDYEVVEAFDGCQALNAFKMEKPDLIILDIMLPEMDGIEVCREIRRSSDVPIIMLTARSEDADKLIGLELGADDYVTKPFSPRELVARVRAVLRRSRPVKSDEPAGHQITIGELALNEERFRATYRNSPVELTPTEFRILYTLARSPGRVYSRSQLLDIALGETYVGYERSIDAHIKNIRHKLDAAGVEDDSTVITVHGVGYKLQEVPDV